MINIPVAIGELVDRIGILEIKQKQIKDHTKLSHINHEHALLHRALGDWLAKLHPHQNAQLVGLAVALRDVNTVIWNIEDRIRDCERHLDFGEEFVELARGVYHNNDRRAEIKKEINLLVGSGIVEEKSYTDYKHRA